MNIKQAEKIASDRLRNSLDADGIIQHCFNCENHKLSTVTGDKGLIEVISCNLAPDSYIPDLVKCYGCPAWMIDIPF